MGNINLTQDGVCKDVLEMFVTVGGVHKRVSGVFVTKDGLHKQVPMEKTLNDYTWEEIAEISAAGQASHLFAVGDTKRVDTTDGYTFTAQIAGFDHDYLADGSGKASISFIAADLIDKGYSMNSTAGVPAGYLGTDMHLQYLPALRATMPSDLLAVIKTVSKLCYVVANTSYTPFETDFWLPSARELSDSGPDDGTVYSRYSGANNNSRIKYVYGTTTARAYWTRTQASALNWSRVTLVGAMSTIGTATTGIYVPLSFCI